MIGTRAVHMSLPNESLDGPNNVFDFSLAFFGCGTDQDLHGAVASASEELLEGWLDAYRKFASKTRLRAGDLETDELRPYFHTASQNPAWIASGVDMEEELWAAVDCVSI